ncbi:C39 family peptidase [Arabiibacter massiliensis]|uniref:C39 family peptidase n=1 Tax=Arabiibacter massiliensis TaxID=1870985 RepID=UPI001E466191|nr:C39 family peptidase [Arabiibacter massiliensis]
MAVPLAGSHSAAADVEAPERAAAEAAALREESGLPRAVSFDVPSLSQYPELPTGCESVALTNALLALGFDLGKTEIAEAWLPQSDSDFVTAFLGDPHSVDGHSCMAPAIVRTAEAYLAAHGSNLEVEDLTGSSFKALLGEVAAGNPVVAWCTIGLEEPGEAYRIASDGDRTYRLYVNSHCVVVHGYDLEAGIVLVSDSLAGQVSYDLEAFVTRYYQIGAQAVAIG